MAHNNDTCFACKKNRKLSDEHIIPQAIGGKLKVKIYCEDCNSEFGRSIDNEISKRFGYLATILDVKRDRGSNQPFDVQELTNNINLKFDGEKLIRKDPIVKIETEKEGKSLKFADVTAQSKEKLIKIIKSIKKKYKISEEFEILEDHHPGPADVKHELISDNKLIRRAVAKMAYSFICYKLPSEITLSESFDDVRQYFIVGDSSNLACANFTHTQFMSDYTRPLHKIHISLNRQDNLIVGYVMLFGIYRYTVLLSHDYTSRFEWPSLDYTFDPVRQEEVMGNPNFRPMPIKVTEVLHPKQSKEFVIEEVTKGLKILNNYETKMEFMKFEPE